MRSTNASVQLEYGSYSFDISATADEERRASYNMTYSSVSATAYSLYCCVAMEAIMNMNREHKNVVMFRRMHRKQTLLGVLHLYDAVAVQCMQLFG